MTEKLRSSTIEESFAMLWKVVQLCHLVLLVMLRDALANLIQLVQLTSDEVLAGHYPVTTSCKYP